MALDESFVAPQQLTALILPRLPFCEILPILSLKLDEWPKGVYRGLTVFLKRLMTRMTCDSECCPAFCLNEVSISESRPVRQRQGVSSHAKGQHETPFWSANLNFSWWHEFNVGAAVICCNIKRGGFVGPFFNCLLYSIIDQSNLALKRHHAIEAQRSISAVSCGMKCHAWPFFRVSSSSYSSCPAITPQHLAESLLYTLSAFSFYSSFAKISRLKVQRLSRKNHRKSELLNVW